MSYRKTYFPRLILFSLSSKETQYFGEEFGKLLAPGCIIALYGDLGAGKTCFTQGLAKGLKVQEEYITSPTFTLINEYKGVMPMYHFDVYRLCGPEELEELGYEEYFYGRGVSIIEWAEKIEDLLPEDYLKICLEHQGPDTRRLIFEAFGQKEKGILANFRERIFFHRELIDDH